MNAIELRIDTLGRSVLISLIYRVHWLTYGDNRLEKVNNLAVISLQLRFAYHCRVRQNMARDKLHCECSNGIGAIMWSSSILPLDEVSQCVSFGWLFKTDMWCGRFVACTCWRKCVSDLPFWLHFYCFSLLDDLWIKGKWLHTGRKQRAKNFLNNSILNKPECNAAVMVYKRHKRSRSCYFWCLCQRSKALFGTVLSTGALISLHWPGDVAAIHHQ